VRCDAVRVTLIERAKTVVKVRKAPASGSQGVTEGTRKGRGTARTRSRVAAAASPPSRRAPGAARRNLIVFLSLVGLLSFTSVLLLALSPAPLAPSAPASLFALDAPQSMDAIFRTGVPVDAGRWRYIFVHHSRTLSGSAASFTGANGLPGDHFVIGNGDGAIDGEIELTQRWAAQLAAAPAAGLDRIGSDCISICLVGDFDQEAPTPTQQLRLTQLVGALQRKLQIRAGQIVLLETAGTQASAGRHFPATAFRTQLLP
jgi:hypothetical protein